MAKERGLPVRPQSEGGIWDRFLKSLRVHVGVDVKSQ